MLVADLSRWPGVIQHISGMARCAGSGRVLVPQPMVGRHSRGQRPLSRRGTGHPHPRPDVRIQPQRERGCFHVAGRSFLPTHVVARAQESGHAVGRDPRNAERRAPERQLGAPTGGRSGQCPSQPGCPHRERWPRFALAWCGHGQAWQSITSGRTCRAVVTVIRPWADRSKGLPSCGRLWAMRHLCGAVHRLDRRRP